MKHTISAVIIAKNEEKRIGPCLESAKWCDEIVVVDDMSTDDTRQVCRHYRAKVVAHASGGDHDKQRNIGIDNSNSQWILQLDADERVTPELKRDIKNILKANSEASAYSVRRKNYFLGRFMRYGGWYETHTRLFKKNKARYVGHSVHETLKVDGKTERLGSSLDHYAFSSVSQYIKRQLYYASVEARVMSQEKGKVIGLKEINYHLKVKPFKLFLKLFFRKQGFRDGMHGFIFSILNAWRHFAIWAVYYDKYYKHSSLTRPDTGSGKLGQPLPEPASGRKIKLSVVTIAYNEERNIEACLKSAIGWAGEHIVVDDFSSDRTVEIAKANGAIVFQRKMDIEGTHRNWAYGKAGNEWVLSLDADEEVTEELKKEISEAIESGGEFDAYSIPLRTYVGDYWVRHGGWYPAGKVRLFRKSRFKYEEVSVHSRILLEGKCGHLTKDIIHKGYEDFLELFYGLDAQTSLEAGKWFNEKRKIGVLKMLWKTCDRFFRTYVRKKGYKDGIIGLVIAMNSAMYQVFSYSKYWEMLKKVD